MARIDVVAQQRSARGSGRVSARYTPTAAKRFGLLLYLVAAPEHRAPRSSLRELLFEDVVRDRAQHGLRELLYQIRQGGVAIDGDAHVVELGGDVECDWAGAIDGEHLDEAVLRATGGGFLPGYSPTHPAAFARWYSDFRSKTTAKLREAIGRAARSSVRREAGWSRELVAAAIGGLAPIDD